MKTLFHAAYHVSDLDQARAFYGGVLGCQEGRSTATWVDYDFFGHQLSLHLGAPGVADGHGLVDQRRVPMPHIGVILSMPDWRRYVQRLSDNGAEFVVAPEVRFAGQPGAQATAFLSDPFGNHLEIKGFADMQGVYAQ
jgi:extradiol dioxygenase family protein